ncbi:MAG: asparagine synthase (glutamine-hydrolyzing) [Candidatus Hydrogenedentota bacterium]|nr:MAG: asparagine synthase (glutamine-hydrolyzing) [Candidatus Hydrogenedentota bacterium]
MCGIAGFLGLNGGTIERRLIEKMTDCLQHRGPNDRGILLIDPEKGLFERLRNPEDPSRLTDAPVALGHRRLSILDLSSHASQPMGEKEAGVWLVFNGEIYNFIELREELKENGYRFHTTSDTEVVLKAYLAWGTDCFAKFNGMWALAIYDHRVRKMILSRDRFGKKPLYYVRVPGGVLFSSEIKSLLKHSAVSREPDLVRIINYAGRHYRYVDIDDRSFFREISQFPKACHGHVRPDGSFHTQRYWSLLPQDPLLDAEHSEDEIVAEFRSLLHSAVTLRLRSDVPVACMLSGGMDSTSITSLAAQVNPDFTAFSGVTGTGYYDESKYIDAVVGKTGIRSCYVRPRPAEVLPTLKEMLLRHDEPVCTVTWLSLFLIAKEISSAEIPVILTGHGGDELLAGYWDHYHHFFYDLRSAGKDDSAEYQAWLRNHRRDPDEYRREKKYVEDLQKDHSLEVRRFSQYLSALSPELQSSIEEPNFDAPFRDSLRRRCWLELLYETVPPVLRAEDRNTMAFSIEARVPFLDYRLAEFCFRLPIEYKIRNGLGKWILREAMRGVLPEKVRTRKDKTGFNAPLDEWIRNDLRKPLEEMIARHSYVNQSIYSQKAVKALFRRHLAGENHYMFFWQYINLNFWAETFLER